MKVFSVTVLCLALSGIALADITTTSVACSPTPQPYTKNYELSDSRGIYWDYDPPAVEYIVNGMQVGADFILPNDRSEGIQTCKGYCEGSIYCRSFLWTNISTPGSTPPFYADCTLSSAPYSPSYWTYESDESSVYLATEVFTVTNFRFPSEILPNGYFESGCLGAWSADIISISSNRTAVVVPCARGECPDNGSRYYAHLYGTPSSINFATIAITNQPVIHDGERYTVSCWVLGTEGLLSFYDGTYNATGIWQKISETRVFHYGDQVVVLVELISPGHEETAPIDWKINGCSVKPV